MIGRLLGLCRKYLRRRRLARAGYLFRYFDGTAYRYEDPLKLYRAILHHPAGLFDLAPAVDQGKEPETSQFLAALCEIFSVRRYDAVSGEGLLDGEILRLFEDFCTFLAEWKKKLPPGSTP